MTTQPVASAKTVNLRSAELIESLYRRTTKLLCYGMPMQKRPNRILKLFRNGAGLLLVLIALRELIGILGQYRWYFPPDFQASAFLFGRESFFHSWYRIAFYAHIVSGPPAILIAAFLVWSGSQNVRITLHRTLGKIQFALVLLLAPSGLIMATRAYTGAVAGIGFATLAVMTLASMVMALVHVKRGELDRHRVWAMRLFILLLSPILLRMISGVSILTGYESNWLYQLSAWGSWLIPLFAYELAQEVRTKSTQNPVEPQTNTIGTLENFT